MNTVQRAGRRLSRRAVFGRAARLGFVLIALGGSGVIQTSAPAQTYATSHCGASCVSGCTCGTCTKGCSLIARCFGETLDCTWRWTECYCCCPPSHPEETCGSICLEAVYYYPTDSQACYEC